jgi:hypothetical protein
MNPITPHFDHRAALLKLLIIIATATACCFLFSQCTTDLKIEKRIEKENIKHPVGVALATRKLYPCITTHESKDTTFLKTDSIVSYVEVPCPQTFTANKFYEPTPRANVVYVKVPIKTASSKEIIHDKIYKEDSSKIFIANKIAAKANEDLKAMESSRNFWRKWALIASALILLFALFQIVKNYIKAIKP